MIKHIFILAVSVSLACSSMGDEAAPKWSIASELLHYRSVSNAPGCETGVLVGPLDYLSRSTNSKIALEMVGRLTSGASKFMLLQRVNIENGVYKVTLLVQPPGTNKWDLYNFDSTSIKSTPSLVRQKKRADELFSSSISSNGGMDCSRYYIFDGTAAYLTIRNATKTVHFGIYEPAKTDAKSMAVIDYESISSLVSSLLDVD